MLSTEINFYKTIYCNVNVKDQKMSTCHDKSRQNYYSLKTQKYLLKGQHILNKMKKTDYPQIPLENRNVLSTLNMHVFNALKGI